MADQSWRWQQPANFPMGYQLPRPRQHLPRYGFRPQFFPPAYAAGPSRRPMHMQHQFSGPQQYVPYARGARGRGRRWHRQDNGRQGYGRGQRPYFGGSGNIEQYYKPSMLDDPWRHFTDGAECKDRAPEHSGETGDQQNTTSSSVQVDQLNLESQLNEYVNSSPQIDHSENSVSSDGSQVEKTLETSVPSNKL